MKPLHIITLSTASAVLAAAVVIGLYAAIRTRHPAHATRPETQNGERAQNRPPVPPEILNRKAPELPAAIRNAGRPTMPKNLPSAAEMHEQFTLLRHFLELPPERLARIRESIESIEKMPPERKKQMLERIREGDANRDRNPRLEAPDSEADIRARASEFIDALPEAEREVVNKHLKGLSREERNAYLEGISVGAFQRKNPDDPFDSSPSEDAFAK